MNVYLVRVHGDGHAPHIVEASSWPIAIGRGSERAKLSEKISQKEGESITVTCRMLAKNMTRKTYMAKLQESASVQQSSEV